MKANFELATRVVSLRLDILSAQRQNSQGKEESGEKLTLFDSNGRSLCHMASNEPILPESRSIIRPSTLPFSSMPLLCARKATRRDSPVILEPSLDRNVPLPLTPIREVPSVVTTSKEPKYENLIYYQKSSKAIKYAEIDFSDGKNNSTSSDRLKVKQLEVCTEANSKDNTDIIVQQENSKRIGCSLKQTGDFIDKNYHFVSTDKEPEQSSQTFLEKVDLQIIAGQLQNIGDDLVNATTKVVSRVADAAPLSPVSPEHDEIDFRKTFAFWETKKTLQKERAAKLEKMS